MAATGNLTARAHREMVGRNFMLAREVTGLGPTAWGRRLGITPQAVWNIEGGRAYPSMLAIVAACDEFGYSADWFLRGIRAGLPEHLAVALKKAEAALPE